MCGVTELVERGAGYCFSCKAIVSDDGIESDAREYECPRCGEYKMYGLEEAILMDEEVYGIAEEYLGIAY